MLLFTYGSLMAKRSMHPAATHIGVARLDNYRWDLHCYADIQPHGGSHVVGVVWEINSDILTELDRREGYPYMYTRRQVTVNLFSGNQRVFIYTMTPDYVQSLSKIAPSEHYLAIVAEGFAENRIKSPVS